jgi:hypothetical protein
MTQFGRIAIMWTLIAVVFLVFSGLFWFVHLRQQRLAPANFTARAATLESSDRATAFTVLREGVAAYRPADPQPYRKLAELAPEDHSDAETWRMQAAFYEQLQRGDQRDNGALRSTLAAAGARWSPADTPELNLSLSAAALVLAAALQLPGELGRWPGEEARGLLWLCGLKDNPSRRIGTTGVIAPVDIVMLSVGGAGAQRRAQMFVRGRDYGGRQRGMHCALIDPGSGQVLQTGAFDLWLSTEESERMAVLLRGVPEGVIGAFAVCDDAAASLTPGLEAELLRFGLSQRAGVGWEKRLLGTRYSFAAIGVKGAPPGSAAQVWSPEFTRDQMGRRMPGHAVVLGAVALAEAKP